MFRTANQRGVSSQSNGFSSASDLPPLNPTSGSVYQPPNSTGSRNALIETQRMRTAVMGQIQAVQSDQDRQIQQCEARMSMVLRELSPKIQNLDRHNSFNQQQLDDLVERLSQLDSNVVPTIQQKCDEVQLKFEQSIKIETQSKFKPISDDIKNEQTKSEQLSDSATSNVSNTNDKLKNLLLLYDDLEKQVSETQNYVQNHIININPRLSTIEAKLIAYEGSAESSMKSQTNQSDFQLSTKKLRKDLEELEIDGIPLAIQSAASDTLSHITSISSQIEQKFTTSKLSLTNMDNTIKMTTEQQKNVDSQVESLSKSSIDIQTNIEQEEQEVNLRLDELENSIKSLNNEIGGKLNELQDNNSGDSQWVLDTLSDDIKSLQTHARQYLTQLNQDWSRFHKDNGETQKITNSEIDNISSILNEEFNLLKKITAAEKRSKWCLSRLQVWQKEVEEAERLNVDDEKLIQKLEILEEKLKETENRLASIDKKKAPKPKKLTKETFKVTKPIPTLADPRNDIETLSIPSNLKLTYDDQEAEIAIPDLPNREERKNQEEDENDQTSKKEEKENKEEEEKKEEKPTKKKSKKKKILALAENSDKTEEEEKTEKKNEEEETKSDKNEEEEKKEKKNEEEEEKTEKKNEEEEEIKSDKNEEEEKKNEEEEDKAGNQNDQNDKEKKKKEEKNKNEEKEELEEESKNEKFDDKEKKKSKKEEEEKPEKKKSKNKK